MTFDEWVISRLMAHGAYSGVVDNVPGRKMIEALKRFQRAEGLKPTGMANEATVAALRRPSGSKVASLPSSGPAVPAEPVWMREALRYLGLKEQPGKGSNGIIMGWAKRLGGWIASFYTDDDIPWCGLAVAHWIAVTLPKEALPANPLGALNWQRFGYRLDRPSLGAVLVFRRDGGGHVGFYKGEDATHFHVLGGNQSNSVSVTRIEKSRLVAIRWPHTAEPPRGSRAALAASGAISRNEA